MRRVRRRLLVIEHGEVTLVLLREVESQYRVEAVEHAAELLEVVCFGAGGRDVVEEAAESSDEVCDLGMATAHRAGRVFTAEHLGENRIQHRILGLFVGQQLPIEEHANRTHTNRPQGLIDEQDGMRIWIKTWGQAIEDAGHRLKFVQERLDYSSTREHAVAYLNETHARYLPPSLAAGTPEAPAL